MRMHSDTFGVSYTKMHKLRMGSNRISKRTSNSVNSSNFKVNFKTFKDFKQQRLLRLTESEQWEHLQREVYTEKFTLKTRSETRSERHNERER